MAQLSRRLQTSVEGFSKLARVLARSGIGLNSTAMMMQRLQRRAADASDGNKQLSDAFDAVGINLGRFLKLDPVEAFVRLGEALANVDDPAKKIQLAFKLLDSEGVALLQTNLPKLREEMAATTAVTTTQAEKVEALAAAWAKMGESARSATAQAFSAFASPADPAAQAGLMKKGMKNALDPAPGLRAGAIRWLRGVLGLEPETGFELQAPKTGRIGGATAGGSRHLTVGDQGAIRAADARAGMLHGGAMGNLAGSDAILEQLRAIRMNTEIKGAILE